MRYAVDGFVFPKMNAIESPRDDLSQSAADYLKGLPRG